MKNKEQEHINETNLKGYVTTYRHYFRLEEQNQNPFFESELSDGNSYRNRFPKSIYENCITLLRKDKNQRTHTRTNFSTYQQPKVVYGKENVLNQQYKENEKR